MTDKDYANTPLWDEKSVASATDKLLQALNSLVKEHNLTSTDVLAVLSRLSAAYIHSMKEMFNTTSEKDAIESVFDKMLQHHLAAFDVRDVQREVEKIKRERMN